MDEFKSSDLIISGLRSMQRYGVGANLADYGLCENDIICLICAMRSEAEATRKDADRYRWLCNGNGYFMEEEGLCGFDNQKEKADAAIDAAMKDQG